MRRCRNIKLGQLQHPVPAVTNHLQTSRKKKNKANRLNFLNKKQSSNVSELRNEHLFHRRERYSGYNMFPRETYSETSIIHDQQKERITLSLKHNKEKWVPIVHDASQEIQFVISSDDDDDDDDPKWKTLRNYKPLQIMEI